MWSGDPLARIALLIFAWICFILGCIGVFVPLLPTTPLVLLATALFARCSPRCYAYIQSTKVYKHYVLAFRQAGGIPLATKARILAISYTVIGISAFLVAKPVVWCILGTVCLFLLWLIGFHIPTISADKAVDARVNIDSAVEAE